MVGALGCVVESDGDEDGEGSVTSGGVDGDDSGGGGGGGGRGGRSAAKIVGAGSKLGLVSVFVVSTGWFWSAQTSLQTWWSTYTRRVQKHDCC